MTDINAMVNNYHTMVSEMQTQMQEAMKELFIQFFVENPEVKLIVWTQYTPYFNDGDECIFHVHDFYFDTEEHAGETNFRYEQIEEWEEKLYVKPKTELVLRFEAFVDALQTMPDDVFKGIFGDHVQVAARRSGFTAEEYEHD